MYRCFGGRGPKAFASFSCPSKMKLKKIKNPQKQFKGQMAIKAFRFPQHLLFGVNFLEAAVLLQDQKSLWISEEGTLTKPGDI